MERLIVTTCVCNKTGSRGLDNPKVVPFVNTRGAPLESGQCGDPEEQVNNEIEKKGKGCGEHEKPSANRTVSQMMSSASGLATQIYSLVLFLGQELQEVICS